MRRRRHTSVDSKEGAEIDKILKLAGQLMPRHEIAEKAGVTRYRVQCVLRSHGEEYGIKRGKMTVDPMSQIEVEGSWE